MLFTSPQAFLLCQPSLMLIRLGNPQTKSPPQGSLFFWALILFLGLLRCKPLLLAPRLRPSIMHQPLQQLNWLGYEFYSNSFVYFFLMCLFFGVIMSLPLPQPPIQFFMLGGNTSRLIFIMFMRRLCVVIFVSDLSLGKIILQISSPNLCLHYCFYYSKENLWRVSSPIRLRGDVKLEEINDNISPSPQTRS